MHSNLPSCSWKPSASIHALRARAALTQQVHLFFEERGVLQVETPLLSQAATTDSTLSVYCVQRFEAFPPPDPGYFLITSPEFFMKRLLCAGVGSIYQITKCFRAKEQGRLHNPEFSMLEWYRIGFSLYELMDEINDFIEHLAPGTGTADRITYCELFLAHLNLHPLETDLAHLQRLSIERGLSQGGLGYNDRTALLQFLFAAQIEKQLGLQRPVFITEFPMDQAMLAEVVPSDPRFSQRFELYWHGIELANGFFELACAKELLRRFQEGNQKLLQQGLPQRPIDHRLIAAQTSGLPACAGVALGIDRFFMLILGFSHISEILSFTYKEA